LNEVVIIQPHHEAPYTAATSLSPAPCDPQLQRLRSRCWQGPTAAGGHTENAGATPSARRVAPARTSRTRARSVSKRAHLQRTALHIEYKSHAWKQRPCCHRRRCATASDTTSSKTAAEHAATHHHAKSRLRTRAPTHTSASRPTTPTYHKSRAAGHAEKDATTHGVSGERVISRFAERSFYLTTEAMRGGVLAGMKACIFSQQKMAK
jgi:hypothetical protein